MLGWALRCFCMTLVFGLTFIGLERGGVLERITASTVNASSSFFRKAGFRGVDLQESGFREPSRAEGGGLLEESVALGTHGHFITEVYVNGTPVTFLVDTGASHTVLRQEDAERLRLDGGRLRYTIPFKSANGTTYAAPVRLRDVRLGQFQLYDLDAFVNQGELGISLLGMSFLRQFESYEFFKDRLVLRW